jgi:hypothetical protein
MVIYTKGSYSWFIKSIIGLISVLIGGFLSVIKYKKERLINKAKY